GDARVVDLLLRRELQDERHQQTLRLDPAGGALLHDLFEKNALMSDVLVDDPEPVASRRDDETLVNLPERRQFGKRGERTLWSRDGIGRKLAVRVETARELARGRRTRRDLERRRAKVETRRGSGGGPQSEVREIGIGRLGEQRRRLRHRRLGDWRSVLQ